MAIFQKTEEQQPQLNLDAASKILENVFEVNQVEPNSIPLEVLTAYSNYRKERFSLQRLIIVLIMVLFFMLPFLFIPADFSVTATESSTAANPTYHLEVTSPMLVKRVNATVNGRNVPVYEVDSHVYSIEPTENGKMAVTVTLMNNQETTHYVDVENVDLEAPLVVSNDMDNDYVYLFLSDTGSGIDYENIEATSLSGQTVKPASYDKQTGRVAFAYPEESLNIYVPDFAKNKLQLVLTVK